MFQGVFEQNSEIDIKEQLVTNSLAFLEKDFSQRLPTNDLLSIEMYIKGELIDKLVYGRNYVFFDSKGRPIWAIMYLLLRAGRIN